MWIIYKQIHIERWVLKSRTKPTTLVVGKSATTAFVAENPDAAEDETLEPPVTKKSHRQSKVDLVAGKNLLPSFLSANGGQGFTHDGLLEEVVDLSGKEPSHGGE